MYTYGIIKENTKQVRQLSTYFDTKPNCKTKYCLLYKTVHKDGSETLTHIKYASLSNLMIEAERLISWYNYVTMESKSIQGYITRLE